MKATRRFVCVGVGAMKAMGRKDNFCFPGVAFGDLIADDLNISNTFQKREKLV